MNSSEMTQDSQFLSFKLENEIFGVNVSQVREVLDLPPITKVPRTPDFMRGVINVRGSVVPVVDMRQKFWSSLIEETVDTCIIVMEITIEDETTIVGAMVDAVEEVVELDPENIEPPPRMGIKLNTEFIKGIGKRDSHFIIILDIDKIFSTEDMSVVQSTGEKVQIKDRESIESAKSE